MKLNFPGQMRLNDIIGRLLGPDVHNAYVVAYDAEYLPETDKTQVKCRPVGPGELQSPNVVVDKWGQPWLQTVLTFHKQLGKGATT